MELLKETTVNNECTNCGGMFNPDNLIEHVYGYWCAPCNDYTLFFWEGE